MCSRVCSLQHMETFVIGQKVRINDTYGKGSRKSDDGSFKDFHGVEGEVTATGNDYIEVKITLRHRGTLRYLFLETELDAVA